MSAQRAAQAFGVVFILVGLAGFLVTGGSMEADPAMAPKLLGLFPVNVLHNLVHLGFGVWGLLAGRTLSAARSYGIVGGVLYLGLALLAFVSPSMFGLVPIGGNDIWLHILLGIGLLAVGMMARTPTRTAV